MADALIWGASGGMGQALTQALHEKGYRIFAAARSTDDIPDVAYRKYRFAATDLRLIRDIAIDLAYETKGLDFWAYTAGSLDAERFQKMEADSWRSVFQSNLDGAFYTTNQTIHLMNEGSHLAYIGAYIDHLILPKMGAYAAAKAGLETMVDVWQKEHRKLNFMLVKPGAVNTPFWESAPFRMPKDAKPPGQVVDALLSWTAEKSRGSLEL